MAHGSRHFDSMNMVQRVGLWAGPMAAALALFLIAGVCRGIEIELKNGRKIEGDIIAVTDQSVEVLISGALVVFPRDQVILPEGADPNRPKMAARPIVLKDLMARQRPTDIRFLSYRTPRLLAIPESNAAHERIFKAVNPDIIALQGIRYGVTKEAIAAWLNKTLPIEGGSWNLHFGPQGERRGWIVLAARYRLTQPKQTLTPPMGDSYMALAQAVVPRNGRPAGIYLITTHLPSRNSERALQSRQVYSDALAYWLGDARRPGGAITLPTGTPMIVLGDFNYSPGTPSDERAAQTLLTGDILNEDRFGMDASGDWDDSALTDLTPIDPNSGAAETCCYLEQFEGLTFRFDRFYYTDSVLEIGAHYILNTQTMTDMQLRRLNLEKMDTSEPLTSFHLPLVVDIRFPDDNVDPDSATNPFARQKGG